jgi:hypothetical protein
MPDTIRSEAELLAQFADNATGNISAQDLRDLVVSAKVDEAQSLALPLDASDPEQIVNIPEGGVSDWADIENKPTFATVATSGSYNDLSNKPTIPTLPIAQSDVSGLDDALAAIPDIPTPPTTTGTYVVHSDGSTSDWMLIETALGLAPVATTGSYNDLSDKPEYATVATSGDYYDLDNRPANLMGNGNLIQPTGYEGAILYQQSDRLQMAPSLTTDGEKITALGFIGSGNQLTGFADVARTGSYGDLTDTPTIPNLGDVPEFDNPENNAVYGLNGQSGGAYWQQLAVVASTGSYGDLTDTPTNLTDFNNDLGLATVATSGSYNDLTDKPTDLSAFNNDLGYSTVATTGDYNDLINKPEYLSDFSNDLGLADVATSGSFNDLSDTPEIQSPVPSDDYQYIAFGSSSSGLVWIRDVDCSLNLQNLQINGVDLATVATSGSYNDLLDKPDIATLPVDAADTTGFATVATSGNYNDLDGTPTDPNPRIPDILTGSHDGTYVVQVVSDSNYWQATNDISLQTQSLTVSDGEDTSTLTPMLLTVNEARINLSADSLNSNGSTGQVLMNSSGSVVWSDPENPFDQGLNMGDNATFNSITVGAAPASFGISSIGEIVAASAIGYSGQVLASGGSGIAASWQNLSDLLGQGVSPADDVAFNSIVIGGATFPSLPTSAGQYVLDVDGSGNVTWAVYSP